VSGKTLVDHFTVSKLECKQRDKKLNVDEDIGYLYDVKWEDGNEIDIRGGELKGYLDVRDGNEGEDQGNGASPNYKGIPFYIKKLNEFVRKFALAMNEGITEDTDPSGAKTFTKAWPGHAEGYGMQKPGQSTSPTGIRFFTMVGWSASQNDTIELTSDEFIGTASTVDQLGNQYQSLKAKNFCVSANLIYEERGEYNVSASGIAGQSEDGSNITTMINMRHDVHLFEEGTPEDYMKSLISTLGIDAQQSTQFTETQENLIKQIENRRFSVSGVSLDEEMTNMIKFQHAYNAAAKMISTFDEIYDTW
jgi:flagellar hook-associated protein 1 FlgK